MKNYSPAAKMQVFDGWPRWARDLANEYGFNTVREFISDGQKEATDLCAHVRVNKQQELLKVRRHRA